LNVVGYGRVQKSCRRADHAVVHASQVGPFRVGTTGLTRISAPPIRPRLASGIVAADGRAAERP
jgi:hypothetical protein